MTPLITVAGVAIAPSKINSDKQDKRIQDALRTIKRVLETQKDAPNAMRRDNIGIIGFRYGAHYPATKTLKRSGYGLAHVVGSAKEDFGKYEGSPTPEEILSIIPEVILDGTVSHTHGNRIRIEHKGHLVILSKSGKRQEGTKWLFHAYKLWTKK
jgi:hypothetical protein